MATRRIGSRNKRKGIRKGTVSSSKRKRRINLSLTPLALECLEHSALEAGCTKSQVIEEWIVAESTIKGGLTPLCLGSKRRGNKGMRGQPISYSEVKQQVTLSLTPLAIKYLKVLARRAGCSRSETIERRLRSLCP
ncbi:MAG TPA: hypothetical protein V6D29_00130 [Leptolyngbyaceae cyanobacterium]